MISLKTYYDTHTARRARFSKKYSVKQAVDRAATFDGRVQLFEDYYTGWFITPLKSGMREGTALIAVSILLSLCDVMEQFKRGEVSTSKTTGEFIKSSLRNVYREDFAKLETKAMDEYVDQIYDVLRNGLHHDLSCRQANVALSPAYSSMFRFDEDGRVVEIFFNPRYFLNAIETRLIEYVKLLSDSSQEELRSKFDAVFSKIFTLEDRGNTPSR